MGIDYTKRPASDDSGSGSTSNANGPVSLSKVTLTKAAPTISLTKQDAAAGTLRVNLNWNARPAGSSGGGFLKRMTGGGGGGAIDLDLGCLYELADGTKGAVQALGNAFMDRNTFGDGPIVWLDGDDRSGNSAAGENLFVDLRHLARIKRIIVFAFIYEGVANWSAADGVVTLFPTSGPQIEVRLDDHDPNARMCGIAMLENIGGELSVRREVRYVAGHRDLDQAYGWGMSWKAGSK
jgi:tellurite resistance protein TerA